jgi:hypothetical protein
MGQFKDTINVNLNSDDRELTVKELHSQSSNKRLQPITTQNKTNEDNTKIDKKPIIKQNLDIKPPN